MRSEEIVEGDTCNLAWKYLGIRGSKLRVLGDNGFPDRIFWVPGGRPLLIEFKAPGEVPRAKQSDTHEFLRDLGYEVQAHDNVHDAFKAIIDAVEPACVSAQSRKVLVGARRCCAVLGSRAR